MLVKEYMQQEGTSYPVLQRLSSNQRTLHGAVLHLALERSGEAAAMRGGGRPSCGHGMAAGGGAGGMICMPYSLKISRMFCGQFMRQMLSSNEVP
jgi:hypothetical protein